MKWPPEKGGALGGAPVPNSLFNAAQRNSGNAGAQVCDSSPLVCGAKREPAHDSRESKSGEPDSIPFLRRILAKLSEIEAQLHSPLTARRLHYCVGCGVRVTNQNVGGYEGKSALTGRLYCTLCCDELEDAR